MRNHLFKSRAGIALAVLSSAALAAEEEDVLERALTIIHVVPVYAFILFALVVIGAVCFMRPRDKRMAPVERILEEDEVIHAVGPDTPVAACARAMSAGKIGALIVVNGEKLLGIFTERDALNRVLAAGLDPGNTKVSEVMTKDPYCIPPTTTVGEAMAVVTQLRFRHLPVVKDGRVLALISSRDLTRWLVKDQAQGVRELVDLSARSFERDRRGSRELAGSH